MRVSLVEFSPSGGLFQFAFQLGAALAELGHEVELVTGPDPELSSTTPGFRVVPLLPTWHPGAGVESVLWRKVRRAGRGVRLAQSWVVLGQHLRATRPDVVQFSEWRFAMDGASAALIARLGWPRVTVALAHSPIPLHEQGSSRGVYKQGRLLGAGLHAGYRGVAAVLVLGESSKEDLLRAWPGVRRAEVIPHGDEGIYLSAEVGPPSAAPLRVVLFGALAGYKGIDLLIDAFALVRQRLPEADLVIAGPLVGDLDYPAIRRRAAEVGGVDLRPGYVPIEEVASLVGSARVMVAPYRRSNASGVVRLAHTLGRPVVVTDVGDLGASVVDGVTGLVVPPDDAPALASALIALLADPARADDLGTAGRLQLAAEASWPIVAERVAGIYRQLLDDIPAGRSVS